MLGISSFSTSVSKTTIIWGMVPNIRIETDMFFCHFGPTPFYSPPPTTTRKIKILRKWKREYGDVFILHTCVLKITSYVWCMLPETWSVTDTFLSFLGIFYLFIPLTTWKIKILKKWKKAWRYHHFTLVYHNWQLCDVWFSRYGARQTKCFIILEYFFALPPKNPENQNFEKNEILHKCTINYNHMMYGSQSFIFRTRNFVHAKTFQVHVRAREE